MESPQPNEIILPIEDLDRQSLLEKIGEKALKFLDDMHVDIKRNITLEQRDFGSPTYQFNLLGRSVKFTTLAIPLTGLTPINDIPIAQDMKQVQGTYIDFHFEDSDSPDKSKEVHAEVQPESMKFARAMLQWVASIKSDILMAPSDSRRTNTYKSNKFLKNITDKHIYLINMDDD